MSTEPKKWIALIALLLAILAAVLAFLAYGPKFLAEHLSAGFMVLPIAMTQWDNLSTGNKIFVVFIAVLMVLALAVFGVALAST